MAPARAIARRSFADGRVRTLSFALLFGLVGLIQSVGYRDSYPTVADRLQFAQSFGANKAVRLFYGIPHDLTSVGGYVSWRFGFLAVFAAALGVFAATRALRAEEDSGRTEIVLAAPLARRTVFRASLLGVAGGALLLWAATWLGLLAGGLAAGPSAYLALEPAAVCVFFAAAGALASQLAPSRRQALGLGMVALAVALVARVVADTAGSLDWLRWLTPLGWAEEMRPFADPQPAVLLLFAGATALLVAVAGRIAAARDVGTGLLSGRDSAPPSGRLLSSPTALTLREDRGSLLGWAAGVAFYAVVVGVLSDSFSAENISQSLQEQVGKLGGASIVTPAGALGLYFLMFAFVIGLFACAQVSAARQEEAESRLETLFALPVGRRAWLGGRLALALAATVALALLAALLAWAAAASQGAGVGIVDLLETGLNCLPPALLFLGLSALAFALVPRATAAVAYGLVSVAFCWYLFGSLLGVPAWTLDLSPFNHLALVPAQPLDVTAALAMSAIGLAAAAASLPAFARRDVIGA